MKRSPCVHAVKLCCPAYAGLNVDDQSPDSDALQSLCRDESADIVQSASAKTLGIVKQGGCNSSEAVDAELISAIDVASEPETPADESGLKNFIRTLEGCKTKFDAEVDDENVPLLLDDDTEADDALDMKIYEKRDPLSCDHLALHLPKCKVCSGCDMGKTSKSNSRRRKRPKVSVSRPDSTPNPSVLWFTWIP